MKFQVQSSFESELRFEPLLFIKFAINKLIRSRLNEKNLFGMLTEKVYYHKAFAIVNVEVHLSHQGKQHVDKVIGCILAAL